jgi:hypothetical protein
MSNHARRNSCSDLGRVLVLNDSPVWLDYKPRGIDLFPEEEIAGLGLSPALGPREEQDVQERFNGRAGGVLRTSSRPTLTRRAESTRLHEHRP